METSPDRKLMTARGHSPKQSILSGQKMTLQSRQFTRRTTAADLESKNYDLGSAYSPPKGELTRMNIRNVASFKSKAAKVSSII